MMKGTVLAVRVVWEIEPGVPRELLVSGAYTPSTPDVRYLRNGDPGYPGDPSEYDDLAIYDEATGDELPAETFEVLMNDDRFLDAMYATADAAYHDAAEARG